MTCSEKHGVPPSLKEVAKGEEASRKKLIEDGGPQKSVDGESSGEDRQPGIAPQNEETGLVDPLKGD